MTIHCIIVEDEPVSQDVLKKYIQDIPQIKLIGVCDNAFEARDMLLENQIHLMFLDINMPKLSGMNFLRTLSNPPLVIFTTAYPQYALEGYEVDAVDYLLKPFSFERFVKAVNKAIDRLKKSDPGMVMENFLLLRADKKTYKIPIRQILFLEAMGDYVKVFYDGLYILVHDTLQHLQDQLDEQNFIRVHRSFVVSIKHITFVEGNSVVLGEREIPIGKSYKEEFLKRLTM